ncbi:hypothetical protein XENOCAPTIV_007082 [Xenoophorus captivus]|uniref:Uncharacterized protein n=1 Tax=Xenoophorus captivus TaxID=1517983 RepID=A0ABV0QQG2_9TELE
MMPSPLTSAGLVTLRGPMFATSCPRSHLKACWSTWAVGCDRSSALVQICAERGFQERRLAAVRELVRLLKPGGQALIYVWAYEQEYNKQKSKYLKDHVKQHNGEKSKDTPEESQESHEEPSVFTTSHVERDVKDASKMTEGRLSVHTNRTAFNSQDLLVPWHLKGRKTHGEEESSGRFSSREEPNPDFDSSMSSDTTHSPDSKPSPSDNMCQIPGGSSVPVFHRYYHVFQQGELEQLCTQVTGIKVQTSYHDQGNWCVVLQKE